MKTLVCGGAGYIGSHFVKYMKEKGEEVVVVDALKTGYKDSVQDVPFYEIDFSDKVSLKEVFKEHKIDACVHFGAFSLVGESMNVPLKYYDNNLCATRALLEVLEEEGIEALIFSSTAAVYGEPEEVPIKEDVLKTPTNPYGETKLAIEKMIQWQANATNLKYMILRYFNVAGAWPDGSIGESHNPETHLIPLAIKAALRGDGFKLFGTDYPTEDGSAVRDYIHVVDLVEAHYLALKALREGKDSAIYNLGYGKGFSVREILDAVKKVSGIDFHVKEEERRAGDPAVLIADASRAMKELSWEPRYNDVKMIIEHALNWHKTHPEGYEK